VLVGLSLGLLGSGGSILTVPLLHAAAGLSLEDAIATSLPVVGAVAVAGFLLHFRRGTVRLAEALPFSLASFGAAFASRAWLAPLLPEDVQALLFAALMAVAAWRMARPSAVSLREDAPPRARLHVLGVAALVGTVTGTLGIGGGFVIVPALVLMLRFDVRAAVGTSLAVIAWNCLGGLAGHWARSAGATVHWNVAALFGGFGLLGAFAGARLAHRLPQQVLRRVFAVVVAAMAAWLLWSRFAGA
jgi:uncharacterized membrane protein YfcA